LVKGTAPVQVGKPEQVSSARRAEGVLKEEKRPEIALGS